MPVGQTLQIKGTRQRIEAADSFMSGSTFTDVDLSEAEFRDVNLADASITDANLSGVQIVNANLRGAAIFDSMTDGMTIDGIAVSDLQAAYRAAHTKAS